MMLAISKPGIRSNGQTNRDYDFAEMNLHSVEANTNVENKASQGLLEAAGFVQEAWFRENYYYNGKFLDSAIYCIIAPKNV
jgi:ribosomal-protein-alanine N-acetyltransferase